MSALPRTCYVTRDDGVQIAYQIVGEGPLDLLYTPGGQLPIDLLWDAPAAARFLHRLASFSRLVLWDPPGWGASSVQPRAPAAEVFADDMMSVIEAVGLDRPALVGWSEGALISMYGAAAAPEEFSALVLINAYARFLRDRNYPHGVPENLLTHATDTLAASWGTGENLRWLAPSIADDEETRAWFGRCERLASAPNDIRGTWMALATRDLRPVLSAIHLPTLVLHRSDNQQIRVGHGRYLADHIPNAAFVELDGVDHLPYTSDSGVIVDKIEEFLTGSLPHVENDRILATVLFTDIVNSTQRAAELGDRRWRELLDHYDTVTERDIERYRGKQIKTTGDGTLATFDGPARAIRCADAIRVSTRGLGIKLRYGLHTGELEVRGEDVAGIAVVIGQRVSTLAEPDQVLVSRTVVDLVAGSGIEFRDWGEHELKGVPGSWKLFAVKG